MSTVKLKYGEQAVPTSLVTKTMISLAELYVRDHIAFLELVKVCHDCNHIVWEGSRPNLIRLGLLRSVDRHGRGQVQNEIKWVVQSAVVVRNLELTLDSPIKHTLI